MVRTGLNPVGPHTNGTGTAYRILLGADATRIEVVVRQNPEDKGDFMMNVIIVGAGGQGRVIADAIQCSSRNNSPLSLGGFLDDNPGLETRESTRPRILGRIADIHRVPHDAVVVGIGDNATRRRLFVDLEAQGENIIYIVHPDAVVAGDVLIGRGTVIFAGVVVNAGSFIGSNVILNTGCTVDHNAKIESHVHICPGVHLAGGITVGEGAFVGPLEPGQLSGQAPWSYVTSCHERRS